jgi:hypothetical protein
MKVLLIFPPLWMPYRPYLSLPSLTAYLKSNGVDVVQKDFNLEAYNLLLSEDYLKGLQSRLQDQFDAMESKIRLTPGMEQEHYYDLYKAKSSIAYVAARIEKAKSVFKNKKAFYDINALSNARSLLKQAQVIISTGCFPTGQDLIWPMNVRLRRSINDIDKLTQNRTENPFLELYEKNLMPFIVEQNPDIIGISITGDGQLMPALTMSRLIKSSCNKAHLVVGGCIVTLLSDVLMKYKEMFKLYFDSAVVHEGERPLLKLVENIANGDSLEDVPNLIYLDKDRICANETVPSENIDSLPTPCFDGFSLDSYLSPETVLPILSSRGCYWGRCAFCSHMESYQSHYQNRNAVKVFDDIQELMQKYGAVHFAFSDEAISPNSINSLAEEFIKKGLDIKCSANARLERQFTPDLCNKIFKAGFRLLYFGLESGCNRILNHMGKGTTKEIAVDICRNAYNAGIWNHMYCFLGFPTETRAEAQETIDFLTSNKGVIHSFNLDNFILAKGAAVMKCPAKFGVTSVDAGVDSDFNFAYNYTVSSGLTSNQAMELSVVSRDKIASEYKSSKFFKLECEDVLLYISHYGEKDPALRAAIKNNIAKQTVNKTLTRKSVPKIKSNVVMDKLKFDILEITNNIVGYKNVPAYHRTVYSIFDPVSGKIWSINPQIAEILAFCDGKKNIQQIAYEVFNKYNIPSTDAEEKCITDLNPLAKEGYIVF